MKRNSEYRSDQAHFSLVVSRKSGEFVPFLEFFHCNGLSSSVLPVVTPFKVFPLEFHWQIEIILVLFYGENKN